MNINENVLNKLTDEQKKKVKAAQTPEELLALAKEAGYELTPEQLGVIRGGNSSKLCNDSDWCTKNTCEWYW